MSNTSALELKLLKLIKKYANEMNQNMLFREIEMQKDDNSHYLIYNVLGVSNEEGYKIDLYQNKGRFLYKYAGSFLEEAAITCIKYKFPKANKIKINNTLGSRPKTFEIDILVGLDAYELKWKDATTDGDHITKEHTRLKAIQAAGYHPIRLMFFKPQREQAIRIQNTLETIYYALNGEYFSGEEAWDKLKKVSGFDLKQFFRDYVGGKYDNN